MLEDSSPGWEKIYDAWLSHGALARTLSDMVESKKQRYLQLLRNELLAINYCDHLLYARVFAEAMSQTCCTPFPHVRALPVSQPSSPGFTFCSFLQYLLAVQHLRGWAMMVVISTHALLPQFEKSWDNCFIFADMFISDHFKCL